MWNAGAENSVLTVELFALVPVEDMRGRFVNSFKALRVSKAVLPLHGARRELLAASSPITLEQTQSERKQDVKNLFLKPEVSSMSPYLTDK
ncbi:hypothetical protein F2P81_021292 [Scophthalmus maximus]|uniref:Uncharacterized protein n=1 Tax=Scophthalmus maximus TaxID=52904 RepID=A0A6A4S2T3_SCOMX|nr:hypothetical protein F2P81_021292 [Scophthalmus maximus]